MGQCSLILRLSINNISPMHKNYLSSILFFYFSNSKDTQFKYFWKDIVRKRSREPFLDFKIAVKTRGVPRDFHRDSAALIYHFVFILLNAFLITFSYMLQWNDKTRYSIKSLIFSSSCEIYANLKVCDIERKKEIYGWIILQRRCWLNYYWRDLFI